MLKFNAQFYRTLNSSNKYDLSASRYRQIEPDGVYYEKPEVTMERLLTLEQVMAEEIRGLRDLTGL